MFRQLLFKSSWSWLYLFLRVPGAEKRYLIFMSVELKSGREAASLRVGLGAPKFVGSFCREIAL